VSVRERGVGRPVREWLGCALYRRVMPRHVAARPRVAGLEQSTYTHLASVPTIPGTYATAQRAQRRKWPQLPPSGARQARRRTKKVVLFGRGKSQNRACHI
jgi:hypothetical protein